MAIKECYQIEEGPTFCFNKAGGLPCRQPNCFVSNFLERRTGRPWPNLFDDLTPEDFALSLVCPISDTSLNDPDGEWERRTGGSHIDPSQYWHLVYEQLIER